MTPILIDHLDTVTEPTAGLRLLSELAFDLALGVSAPPALGDALPAGWAWSSLRRLGTVLGGGTPSKSAAEYWGGSIPWVSPKDMKVSIITDAQDHITDAALRGASVTIIPPGALLMVVRGMILVHSFPTALTSVPVAVNQDMKAIVFDRPEFGPYVLLVTKALRRKVVELVERSTHGTCRLPTDSLLDLPLPLPPLAEQVRIVAAAKSIVSSLEGFHEARAKADITRTAALTALTSGIEGEADVFKRRALARVLAADLTDLVRTRADVHHLRLAILGMGMNGTLAPGGSKRTQWGPDGLPEGWRWARFDQAATIRSRLVDPAAYGDAPHIAPDSIEKGTGRLVGYRTIAADHVTSAKHLFTAGQILYSKIRPNLSKVVTVDFDGLCSADMYPIQPLIDRRFLHLYMLSPAFLKQVVADANRLAMPKVNQVQLGAVMVPVPPPQEQVEIGHTLTGLLADLDEAEAHLEAAHGLAEPLAFGAIAEFRDAMRAAGRILAT